MAGKKGQTKRFWADEETRSICEQALAPGVSVAQGARRYSMNANLIFKWLKAPRFSPAADETKWHRKMTVSSCRWKCRGRPSTMMPTALLSGSCRV